MEEKVKQGEGVGGWCGLCCSEIVTSETSGVIAHMCPLPQPLCPVYCSRDAGLGNSPTTPWALNGGWGRSQVSWSHIWLAQDREAGHLCSPLSLPLLGGKPWGVERGKRVGAQDPQELLLDWGPFQLLTSLPLAELGERILPTFISPRKSGTA